MGQRWFKKRLQETLDVDEVFFDSFQLAHRDLKWHHRLETLISARPIRWLWFLSLAVFVLFGARGAEIALFKKDYFSALARQNAVWEQWQRAERGIIYSADKRPLVKNVSTFNLVAIPAELPPEREKQETIITFIQETFHKERAQVLALFEEINRFSSRPVPLALDLSRQELLIFESRRAQLPGLELEENFKRQYPQGLLFSHPLGYTGLVGVEELKRYPNYLLTDIVGKSGLELSYESVLRGEYGRTKIETSSRGRGERVLNSTEAKPGQNLILFIDSGLQERLGKTMSQFLAAAGLSRGAAIALDPRSGGVLALVNFPLYDNNVFSQRTDIAVFEQLFNDPEKPLFNRALAGLYPPGSTVKSFLAVAGLEEKVIDEKTTVNVTGSITVAGQEFRDWRPHGLVDLKRAIAVSSNVFFYSVGGGYGEIEGLGPYRIYDYLSRFGLNALTGIDLVGERAGFVPDPSWKRKTRKENWYIGDTYNLSIGQGDLLVTPIGLATAVGALANSGTALKPRLVKVITGANFEIIQSTSPEIIYQDIASTESIKLVREGMRETVKTGSARMLNSLPVPAAGKTGTAQSRPGQDPHAWFVAFAPYENPEIVVVVLIENGGGGQQIAVPIVNEVLDWYFSEAGLR